MKELVLKLQVQEDHLRSEKQLENIAFDTKENIVEGQSLNPKCKGLKTNEKEKKDNFKSPPKAIIPRRSKEAARYAENLNVKLYL